MEKKTDLPATLTVRAGSESPTSKCPICLSMIDNPAFTDICIHQFCFTCLCEWAKVKAVCPVCKQDFQSIAYNVQSYEKFDELPVKNLIVADTCARFQDNHTGFQINAILNHRVSQIHGHPQDARFRYRTTMTSDYRDVLRRLEEQRVTEELRNPLVRVTVNHRPFVFSSNARKAVYRTGLRVQHLQTSTEQVFSLINPQFFNDNPACKIRLSPWLQRELDVMTELSDTPVIGDTMLLINLIFTLLNTLKITSQNFYNKLYPYLRRHTLHFIQELYCFACSAPYTMPQYDSCVVYGDGTSGAIWRVWHRDKAHGNSSIATAIRDTTREDAIEIPSDRGFIPFVMTKHRRNTNQSSVTPVQGSIQGASGMSTTSHGPIDLVQESSDSNSEDVEVVGQDPPWNARRPIVISDSEEEETTGREVERVESRVDGELKYPVSKVPKEHADQRTSRDSSQTSSVTEQRLHSSEVTDETAIQESMHNSQRRKNENKSADERRGISDNISVEKVASHQMKARHRQSSPSGDRQSSSTRDSLNHDKKLKHKNKKDHFQEGRSGHSKDLKKYVVERSSKEPSTTTERRKEYKRRSRERSRSYHSSRSKEQSRTHRRSRSKERVRTKRSRSKEESKAVRQSRSKERDGSSSRTLHSEHQVRHSGHWKRGSSELGNHSDDDGFLKEQQQCTKRKRFNSGRTYSCDSSDVDANKLSSNRTYVLEHSFVSSASDSQSSSSAIPKFSNVGRCLESCRPSFIGEDLKKRDGEVRPQTNSDPFSCSYVDKTSDIVPRDVSHEDSCGLSTVAKENNHVNDRTFVRKTCFWSDEEENSGSEDYMSSRSNTLRSQIGCKLLSSGNCDASSALEPLTVDEDLIIIESSDCSSSNHQRLSKDYDTKEAGCSHKNKILEYWNQSSMSSKNSRKGCEKEIRSVSRDSSAKESSYSLENQEGRKHRSQRQTSYTKHKRERRGVDLDSSRRKKMTDHVKNDTDVGLATDRFDETAAQHKMSDDSDDDDISCNKSLDVADELMFKKHFTGHKNSRFKTANC